MKTGSILTVAFFGLMCIVSVYSQTASTETINEFKQLENDYNTMKAANKFDGQKLLADVKALASAAKANMAGLSNAPPQIQAKIQDIQTKIAAVVSSGKGDPTKVAAIVQAINALMSM